jgi:hypothetical protein
MFTGRYLIDWLDHVTSWIGLITTDLSNKAALRTQEIQSKIDDLAYQGVEKTPAIGFQINDYVDEEYLEEEPENKNKIGFR